MTGKGFKTRATNECVALYSKTLKSLVSWIMATAQKTDDDETCPEIIGFDDDCKYDSSYYFLRLIFTGNPIFGSVGETSSPSSQRHQVMHNLNPLFDEMDKEWIDSDGEYDTCICIA